MFYKALLIYLCIISLVSITVCCYDKFAAKRAPRHRVREATLMLLSILGGSVAMYLTMLTIRHKTKHKRFMIGIPFIIVMQLALTIIIRYFLL